MSIYFSFFCTEWVVAETTSRVRYFSYEQEPVTSRIKLQLGFSNANITLKAENEELFPNRYWNERIVINNADVDFEGLMTNGIPVGRF